MKNGSWEKLTSKIDSLSLRERVLIFAAMSSVLIALTKSMLVDPLLLQQKKLAAQVVQQQDKLREMQAQLEVLQHPGADQGGAPLGERLQKARQQLAEGAAYIQQKHERLVAPDKMAELLEQVLSQNGRLQLLSLHNLSVTPVLENPVHLITQNEKLLFKHGVQITVRGSYLDLLQYLTTLEQLPSQMYWGEASMRVEKHPDAVLSLTLYTLSLDKTWLQI